MHPEEAYDHGGCGHAGSKRVTKTPAGTDTCRVELPHITNDAKITAGDNLMLQWTLTQKAENAPKTKTWVDDVAARDKKRRRGPTGM